MKQIQLTRGRVALVDDEDFEYLNQWKWYLFSHNGKEYGYRTQHTNVKVGLKWVREAYKIHRVIMDAPKGLEIDHINGNGLDNRKSNLRLATRAENARNVKSHRDSTSKYLGVSWAKRESKWKATIMLDRKQKHIGYYHCEKEAALAYNGKAAKHFKAFANLNEVA